MRNLIFIPALLLLFSLGVHAQGEITFETKEHSFGKIKEEGGPVTYTFNFENTGSAPVTITNVRASCGCTTPSWSKEPVLPGKTGHIKAQYNPMHRPGKFHKTLTITANTMPATHILTIKGEVIPKPAPTQNSGE